MSRVAAFFTKRRWVRLACCAVLGLLTGLGLRAVGITSLRDANVVTAVTLASLPSGTQLRGLLRFAGTAEAPAVVFFADDGRTFGHVCRRESWAEGCSTLQLQGAFAHAAGTPEVPDVELEAHGAGHELTVVLGRSKEEGPFLVLELGS